MATIVQSKSGEISSTIPITFDSAVTAGNTILVLCLYRFDLNPIPTDGVNTYSSNLGHFYHGNGSVKCSYATNIVGGTTSILFDQDIGATTAVLLEVAGLATSNIVDASVENSVLDTSNPYAPGLSITTTNANTFLVVLASDFDNDARNCTGGTGIS